MPPSTTASAPRYADDVVKMFIVAAMAWAIVGMAMGVIIAFQLAFPSLNLDLPWTTFGRLRPLHTSGVIFAFGGSMLIGTSFYVVQRTCRTRLFGGFAAEFVFWGYQLFIVLAALGYVTGVTQSREYAEPEWFVDIWLAIVWIVYLVIFLGTLARRQEPHIYVANWYYLAFIITIAILHIVNNLAVPVSWSGSKSYSLFAGVQDAMTQWWYGHSAVAFFLTAGFLGMMYYFVPKQADRPIYSYRLSILGFWSLVFIYIWAGPHHLHFTALPDWAQTLGMTFSLMLWMPSWASMVNGIGTVAGRWDSLRTDPILRFMVVAVAFYGMSTFEGPLMAIKTVNGLSHYTDWTVGHVHSGALGWVAFICFGALYHLVPRLWGRPALHSTKLVEVHFWLGTLGVLLYITSMWASGIMQGLMWRAYDELGFLQYSFVETVMAMHPYYIIRALGGVSFLTGAILMVYNLSRTIREPRFASLPIVAAAE